MESNAINKRDTKDYSFERLEHIEALERDALIAVRRRNILKEAVKCIDAKDTEDRLRMWRMRGIFDVLAYDIEPIVEAKLTILAREKDNGYVRRVSP